MALLSRRGARRAFAAVALIALSVVAGCGLGDMFGGGPPPFAFSHRIHVTNESIDCVDCHRGAQDGDAPGMPVQNQCMLCHQAIDEKKPPERHVSTLFDGKDYRAQHANKLASEVVFSHKLHVAKGQQCTACHAGIETDDAIQPGRTITMDSCTSCHTQQNVVRECATCHRDNRLDHAPRSHALQWTRLHGQAARAHGEGTADRCTLCHTETSCAGCHATQAPANHNNYWRQRGHGLTARMDRENCAACHRSDSCDSCHQQARPINHTALWGGTRDTHCVNCHLPLSGNDCATCHRDTVSHTTAVNMPGNHTIGMNCRQCHGLTAPLPHVDNGDECTRCHH